MVNKKRKGKKRPQSLAKFDNLILKAIESADRKGKDWKSDKRTNVLLKAKRKLLQKISDNQDW